MKIFIFSNFSSIILPRFRYVNQSILDLEQIDRCQGIGDLLFVCKDFMKRSLFE